MTNSRQIKFGVILQYCQVFLNVAIGLIYTPIMLSILGDAEYGIYSLCASVLSYLTLLTAGLSAGYLRFYFKYNSSGDQDAIRRMNGLYLISYLVLGSLAFICGAVVAFNVRAFLNSTYSEADALLARQLLIILAINLALSFPASLFTSYITSQERFVFLKVVNMGKTVLSPCLSIAFLLLGHGSIGMAIVSSATTICVEIANLVFCFRKLKMRFSFKNLDLRLLKQILIFSSFITINQIVDQINWQTDKVILGKMINASAVAVYTVASTLNSMYATLSTAISSVFAPRINRIVFSGMPEEDKNRCLSDLFIRVGRIQFFVLGLVLSGFVFFGRFFIGIWAGPTYELAYYITLLLIAPFTVPLIQNVGIEILQAKNKHKFRSLLYLGMALVNIGVSIWFCSLWGLIGVAIGTTMSLIIANGICINIYYAKVIKLDIKRFWLNILQIFPSLVFPIAFGIICSIFVRGMTIPIFISCVLGYTLIYCLSIWAFGLNQTERNVLSNFLNRIRHHK